MRRADIRGVRSRHDVLAATLILTSITVPTTARAQHVALRAEAAATVGTAWVEDGNGATVRQGLGGTAGIEIAVGRWRPTAAVGMAAAIVGVRTGITSLRVAEDGDSWQTGHVRQLDLLLGGRVGLRELADARVAVVHSWIDGPRDVTPFRRELGGLAAWGVDASLSRAMSRRLPLRATVGIHALRIRDRRAADLVVNGGWVGRLRVGVQYAR